MGKGSIGVLSDRIDIKALLEELNVALAEEWLSFYQYWVGAQIVEGLQRAEVEREFLEHAQEEFQHAQMLADRIKELDGVPVLSPQEWFQIAQCKYEKPTTFDVMGLLNDNIHAERCAIKRYQHIADITEGIDFVTNRIAKRILMQEEEHEQDLVDFKIDIDRTLEWIRKQLEK